MLSPAMQEISCGYIFGKPGLKSPGKLTGMVSTNILIAVVLTGGNEYLLRQENFNSPSNSASSNYSFLQGIKTTSARQIERLLQKKDNLLETRAYRFLI
jgi:hypothetical protein